MQLELERRALQSFETLYCANISKDESADIIVPDSFPDILNIIEARGLACLKEKRCTDTGVELRGAVRVSVLYRPDNVEEGVVVTPKRLDMVIPFQHIFEHKGLPNNAVVFAQVCLQTTVARTINPRKIQVSVSVNLDTTVYGSHQLQVTQQVVAPPEAALETLIKTSKLLMPVSIKDKTFVVTDQIELPSGRPAISQILHAGIRLMARENKIIGNKAVFKGGAVVSILYLTEDADTQPIATWEQEIPFSQILEMDDIEESGHVNVTLNLVGLDLQPSAGAHRVDVEIQIDAQAIAMCEKRLEFLSDIYSTKFHVLPDVNEIRIMTIADKCTQKAQARETFMVQPPIHTILDSRIDMAPVTLTPQQTQMQLGTVATISVLYLTDDSEYETAQVAVPVMSTVDMSENTDCFATAQLTGDLFTGVSADGLEVRFGVSFEGMMTGQQNLLTVGGIRGDWATPKVDDGQVSVILRRTVGQESLWDIAKCYGTTQKDIIAANAFTDNAEMGAGSLLLIPRKR